MVGGADAVDSGSAVDGASAADGGGACTSKNNIQRIIFQVCNLDGKHVRKKH